MLRRLLLSALLVLIFAVDTKAQSCGISFDRTASEYGGPDANGDYFIDMAAITGSNSGCPNGGEAPFSITWILQKQYTQTTYPFQHYWVVVETYCTDYTDTCCGYVAVESAYVDPATCKTLHGSGSFQQIAQLNATTCANRNGQYLGVLTNGFIIP